MVNGGCFNLYGGTGLPVDWPANGACDYRVPFASASQSIPVGHTTLDFVSRHDGLSTTILMSENLDAVTYIVPTPSGNAFQPLESAQTILWDASVMSFTQAQTAQIINQPVGANAKAGSPYTSTNINLLARPSSNHPNGAVFAFCDGHVAFINQSMSYQLYATLLTSCGAQAAQPGTPFSSYSKNTTTGGPNGDNYYNLQLIPLDASLIPSSN